MPNVTLYHSVVVNHQNYSSNGLGLSALDFLCLGPGSLVQTRHSFLFFHLCKQINNLNPSPDDLKTSRYVFYLLYSLKVSYT